MKKAMLKPINGKAASRIHAMLSALGMLLAGFGCATSSGSAQSSTETATEQPARPNIVFILLDNVGWGDFSCYGGVTPTPRTDELAREGIRFNNYNVECQCTPSRAAIMTGRMPVRSGTYKVTWATPFGLSPFEYTIANLLSDDGYATALYGKWHIGDIQGRFPSDKGFDEWWGVPNTWDEAGNQVETS